MCFEPLFPTACREVAGHYFYEKLGYRTIGVLYAKNDYSQGLFEGMTASFEKAGGKMIISEAFRSETRISKPSLPRFAAPTPRRSIFPTTPLRWLRFLSRLPSSESRFLRLPDGFSNPDIYNLAGDFTHGVVYVGPAQVAESQAYSKFKSDYEKKFGVSPDSSLQTR